MSHLQDELRSDQVFHLFLSLLHNTRRHSRRMIDERGVKPRDFSVLRYLRDNGPATVGKVQGFIHKSPSTTSVLIAELEDKGLVTRTRSREDNRVVIVELTPTGREVADNTPLGGLPLLRRRLMALPDDHLVEIQAILEEIIRLMEVDDNV